MIKLYLLLIVLNFSLFSFAVNDSTKIVAPVNDSTVITKKNKTNVVEKNLSELDYYKLLYEQQVSNSDSYVSLIQLIIGVSVAFLLAIIGSQIFFNYRINKKELDYIKKDLDDKIANLKNELLEKVDSKFGLLETRLKDDFNKSEIDAKERIEKFIESENKIRKLQFEIQENSIKQSLKFLEKNVEKNSGDLWKLKGVESNALSSFLRVAFIQIDLKHEVKYILDDIIEILDGLDEINNSDYKGLEELCEKLKTFHSSKISKIEALYKKKPVYEFVDSNPSEMGGLLGIPMKKYIKNKK